MDTRNARCARLRARRGRARHGRRRARHQAHRSRPRCRPAYNGAVVRQRRPVRDVRRHDRPARSTPAIAATRSSRTSQFAPRNARGMVEYTATFFLDEADRHGEVERHPPAPGAATAAAASTSAAATTRANVRPVERLAGRHDRHAGRARHGAGREERRRVVDHRPVHVHDRRSRDGQPDQRRRQHGDRSTPGLNNPTIPVPAREHRHHAGALTSYASYTFNTAQLTDPRLVPSSDWAFGGLHGHAVPGRPSGTRSACAAASTSRASIASCIA